MKPSIDSPSVAIVPELSRPIKIDNLPENGLQLTIDANDQEKSAIATRFNLSELSKLSAEITLSSDEKGKEFELNGSLSSEFTQECVVSLEPIQNQINVDFTVRYVAGVEITTEEEIVDFDPAEDDPPETIVDGILEVGEVITQHFGLELNPFPRKSDISLSDIVDQLDGLANTNENPFSALKRLKNADK